MASRLIDVWRAILHSRTATPAADLAGALGPGIDWTFGSITIGSGTRLSQFVEGTFTPVVKGSTTAGTGTYTAQQGFYTRIGNRCWFNLNLVWTATTGTGNMQIGGLPFTANAATGNNAAVVYHTASATVPSTSLLYVLAGAAVIGVDTANGAGQLAIPATGSLYVSGHYAL